MPYKKPIESREFHVSLLRRGAIKKWNKRVDK